MEGKKVPLKNLLLRKQNVIALGECICPFFVNKLKEKSKECHNHKSQPTPDTKRKMSMKGFVACGVP